MSNKSELLQARADMAAVLDEKLKNMPEWRAFRAIDRAIAALDTPRGTSESPATRTRQVPRRETYADVGVTLIEEAGRPMATGEIIPAIASRRGVDPSSRKVVIQTALSRDGRIENIKWHGGRAWWIAKREPPKESAGLGLS